MLYVILNPLRKCKINIHKDCAENRIGVYCSLHTLTCRLSHVFPHKYCKKRDQCFDPTTYTILQITTQMQLRTRNSILLYLFLFNFVILRTQKLLIITKHCKQNITCDVISLLGLILKKKTKKKIGVEGGLL